MKVYTRVIGVENNVAFFNNIDYEQLIFTQRVIMAIDGSTTCTGIGFLDYETKNIVATMAFKRTDETKVMYKVKMKRVLESIFKANKMIENVYYEEHFIEFEQAAEALFMIRSSVQEIIAENHPILNYIKYMEVNNKRWKKLFLAPDKMPPGGSKPEKKAVRDKMILLIPIMSTVTQDEIDACALGFVAISHLTGEGDRKLKSNKSKKFVYNIEFIGSEDDAEFYIQLPDLLEEYKIPAVPLSNGVRLVEIKGAGNFENYLFAEMGDDDLLLVLKFKSKHHSNIVLQYRVGYLTTEYDYIYSVIWRKHRKKLQ